MAGNQKHSNVEIAQAKMLARRLAGARGVRTTLGVSGAIKFFLAACWAWTHVQLKRVGERINRSFLMSSECPHCFGAMASESDECKLCHGRGRITAPQREAVTYGKWLLEWRLRERKSAALCGYMTLAVQLGETTTEGYASYEAWWLAMENGYMPLEEWPLLVREIVESEMSAAKASELR